MNLLELAQQHTQLRKVGSEWHGPCPHCGSGGDPAKSDRFSVKADDRFFCRTCTPQGGDAISFLRQFDGMSCPEAHAALGKECDSSTCPVLDKCRKGQGKAPRRDESARKTAAEKETGPAWSPSEAASPRETWSQNAATLVDWAHHRLLAEPDQIAYLQARGLPLEAVKKHRLGWWPETKFRPLSEWGLPEEKNEQTGRPRRLWIPRGIVIPTINGVRIERVRIRRHPADLEDGRGKYVALKGSGNEVPVYGADRKAFVVVESDLDGLLIDTVAGDMVGSVPLASCSVKPRSGAYHILKDALAILVALDFEPRGNETTGKHENPGGQSARWWLEHFPQAERWPVPVGKDPGDAYEQGVDLRAWILEGLPPGLRIQKKQPSTTADEPPVTGHGSRATAPESPAPEFKGHCHLGVSDEGIAYLVAEHPEDLPALRQRYPDHVPFTAAEIRKLKGLSKEEAAEILKLRRRFPEGQTIEVRAITGDGRPEFKHDPSVQRKAHRRADR